jgi:hypothetical protein
MLYLHCGWPRTSTSSLQAALFEYRHSLAASGVVYPDRWRTEGDLTHHGLAELLKATRESPAALDDFKRFIAEQEGEDILLSAEVLTYWLRSEERLSALVGLLAAAQEVTPTRCIWTLRRLDDALSSLYLRQLSMGAANRLPAPAELFAGVDRLDGLFAGMQRVESAVGGEAAYVRYDPAGTHNAELLAAFEIHGQLKEQIVEALAGAPRLNVSPTHKEAVTLLHLDALSARTGAELKEAAVRNVLGRRDFAFETDWPCEVVDRNVSRALHKRALAAARRVGFTPYVDYFSSAELDAPSSPALAPEILTDADLKRLLDSVGV